MNLKDAMAADIDDVFMSLDEFAEYHDINGQSVVCVVEGRTNKEHVAISRQSIDGVTLDEYIVHVKKSLLPSVPEQGMRLMLDDRPTTVSHCDDDGAGMLTITLEGHDAGGITYGY